MLLIGPLVVYAALAFVSLRRQMWFVIMTLLALLLASSAVRVVTVEGVPVSPLIEMAGEVFTMGYLYRRRVRAAFGITGPRSRAGPRRSRREARPRSAAG